MEKVELTVMGITYNPVQNGAYALLLREVNGPHRIPIVVGASEAHSIAVRLENMMPPRPLTHDLMNSVLHAYGISVEEVMIYEFSEGVFKSQLTLNNGKCEISLDSRTSDAIALALRTNARIFTTPEIVKKTGIYMEEDKGEVVHKSQRNPDDYSIEELKQQMQQAVDEENYERAAEIKQLISERTSTESNKI